MHMGVAVLPVPVPFWVLSEIALDIVQHSRDIGKEIRVAFDAINVDESPRRFEVTLDAREVEQTAEGLSISPYLPMRCQLIEIAIDQAVDQRLVKFDVRVTQQRGKIVRCRPHQGVLKVNDPQPFTIDHQIARMIVPVDKDARLAGKQLGDVLEIAPNGQVIIGAHPFPPPRYDPVLQKMVEFPHEERHIETSVERETMWIGL